MQIAEDQVAEVVNCRIGSLEMKMSYIMAPTLVNCRIGSLETDKLSLVLRRQVNCRIGSLEIKQPQQD